eukprot:CAMPEP_0181175448 /NCGR_PEP_ID=MMETSP1096-20121128/4085_1 /TAXON_ID=156174 ORGANISM="Chrysochromulina ericina, Strain CCMP281" /NCGR_SAMPLE_ID=MMETSP1096 /ASSEMBLY_ACC=CAM_ASM_000453 /LENGTH=46 /DNA_ID= /DNA_START= /DNA_END= /DNA_ORIENTATION=
MSLSWQPSNDSSATWWVRAKSCASCITDAQLRSSPKSKPPGASCAQ